MIFYKITVINGTFCTKRQTSCFDVADNTATAGIYGERLPDVGKHAFKLPPAVVEIRRPRTLRSLITRHATADKRTHARSTETACNHQ